MLHDVLVTGWGVQVHCVFFRDLDRLFILLLVRDALDHFVFPVHGNVFSDGYFLFDRDLDSPGHLDLVGNVDCDLFVDLIRYADRPGDGFCQWHLQNIFLCDRHGRLDLSHLIVGYWNLDSLGDQLDDGRVLLGDHVELLRYNRSPGLLHVLIVDRLEVQGGRTLALGLAAPAVKLPDAVARFLIAFAIMQGVPVEPAMRIHVLGGGAAV